MSSPSVAKAKRPWSWRRFIRRRVQFWGGAYLLIVFGMWLFENRLVYHPTPASEDWMPAPNPAIQDVTFDSPDGTPIHAWWLPREPNDLVLLVCHGNSGNLSHRGVTLDRLSDRLRVSVLIFDYPGFGKTLGKPNEPRCYDAAEAAIRWLRDDRKVPTERIILYGESLGGGVATELATRYSCHSLVLVKTFSSVPAAAKFHYPWVPCHWLMTNRFDNLAKIGRVNCPVLIASGTADRTVPYEHGEALFAAANEPKEFYPAIGSDHNDPMPDEFWDRLGAFLKR